MRRIFVSIVGAVAIVALLAGCDGAVPRRFSFSDPAGDQRAGTPFEVDILGVVVKATTEATVTVDVDGSVPFEEWGTAIHSISVTILDGDRTVELFADRDGAALYRGSGSFCGVRRKHNAELSRYSFSFNRDCLDDRMVVRVKTVRTFHIPGDRADRADHQGNGTIPAVCFPDVQAIYCQGRPN